MPAPIVKGPYPYYQAPPNAQKTNPNAAKSGVIITVAVLIAAGYAVYENREHVKNFMNHSGQKIKMAMSSFADEYMTTDEEKERRRRRLGSPEEMHQRTPDEEMEDFLYGDEKGATTGRDNWQGDSVYRHRSVHNRSMVDDDEPVRNPFGDEHKIHYDPRSANIAPSESSATLSAEGMIEEKAPMLPPRPGSLHRSSVSSEQHGAAMPQVLFSADAVQSASSHSNTNNSAPAPQAATPAADAPVSPAPVTSPGTLPSQAEGTMEQSGTFDPLTQQYRQAQQFWSINEWSHDVASAEDRSDVQSQSSLGNDISVIGSEVDEDENFDHRVEAHSDMASSVTGSWSEVGSEVSADELVNHPAHH